MAIEALLARYGIVAVFLGAGLEGETAVVTGGLLAHRGLVPLPAAMAAAVAGSFLADQLFFLLGRRGRDWPRVRRLMARPLFARALRAFERRPAGFILAFRFLYGLRTISPVAIGTTQVPARTFVPLNLLAACVWGVGFTTIGYLFGQGVEAAAGRFRPSGAVLVAAAALALAAVGLFRWRRR